MRPAAPVEAPTVGGAGQAAGPTVTVTPGWGALPFGASNRTAAPVPPARAVAETANVHRGTLREGTRRRAASGVSGGSGRATRAVAGGRRTTIVGSGSPGPGPNHPAASDRPSSVRATASGSPHRGCSPRGTKALQDDAGSLTALLGLRAGHSLDMRRAARGR